MQRNVGQQPKEEKRVRITPAMAKAWLASNTNNRSLRPGAVDKYAREMAAGNWRYAPMLYPAIAFNKEGRLVNGQHRLRACVKSDTPFEVDVVRGVDDADVRVADENVPRTWADVLRMEGVGDSSHLQASCMWLYCIKNQTMPNGTKVSNDELAALFHKNAEIALSLVHWKGSNGLSPSLLCTVHYIARAHLLEYEKADQFMSVFKTLVPTWEGDPAHLLASRALRTKLSPSEKYRSIIHCWNIFRTGAKHTKFVVPVDGIPTIDGLDLDRI